MNNNKPISNGTNGNGRNNKGQFTKNNPGGPGAPSGRRTIAINIIFELFNKYRDNFRKEMDALAKEDIVAFYMDYVEPLQPKKLEISGEDGEPIQLVNIDLSKFPDENKKSK